MTLEQQIEILYNYIKLLENRVEEMERTAKLIKSLPPIISDLQPFISTNPGVMPLDWGTTVTCKDNGDTFMTAEALKFEKGAFVDCVLTNTDNDVKKYQIKISEGENIY